MEFIFDNGERAEFQKGGPFIGPRGGKWADAGHKIPWKEQKDYDTSTGEGQKRLMYESRGIDITQKPKVPAYYKEGERGHDPILDAQGNPTGKIRMVPTGRVIDVATGKEVDAELPEGPSKPDFQKKTLPAPEAPKLWDHASTTPVPKGQKASYEVPEMLSAAHGPSFKQGDTIKLGNTRFKVLSIHKFTFDGDPRYEVLLQKPKGRKGSFAVLYGNGVWSSVTGGGGNQVLSAGYRHTVEGAEKSFREETAMGSIISGIDAMQEYLEKALPPPAATQGAATAGAGAPANGAYSRRWKGPAGKWLYEFDHPDHKAAIDASNAAESHPGTAGDLVGAHQAAMQAHLKAGQAMKEDPHAAAEHAQVAADHAKAGAIVHTNHVQQPGAANGAAPAGGQPPSPAFHPGPQQPPPAQQPGAPAGAVPPLPPQPGATPQQPPVKPGAAPQAAPPVPPGQQPPKTQPGAPAQPQPPQAAGQAAVPGKPGKPGEPAKPGKPPVPPQKDQKVRKSMDAIEILNEYLAKAQDMPEGGPKEKMGTGEEQGGKLAGVGETSGSGDSAAGPAIGAPSPEHEKLSEDDREDEDQLKPHKKPIETAKSMAVPQHQRDMVRHEVAAAISQLQKSDDVELEPGVPALAAPLQKAVSSIFWKQGQESVVGYSNRSDLEAERLLKSDSFYHGGESPSIPARGFVGQQVRCQKCQGVMSKSLAVCPSCGEGAQRSLPRPKVLLEGDAAELSVSSRPGLLRPARVKRDVHFPGK